MRRHAERQLDPARAILRPHLPALSRRRPAVYWTDLLATALVAWPALLAGAAITSGGLDLGALARAIATSLLFVVAVVAFYRASAFLHEVAHVRAAMPLFATAWDALIGVPLLTPSLLYDGVHTTHHDRAVFGTDADPEYVPAEPGAPGGGHGRYATMLASFALVPVLLVVRWAILGPISALHAPLRRFVVERCSSLAANPRYRRPLPAGRERTRWMVLESACAIATLTIGALAIARAIPLASILFVLAVLTAVSVLHGTRSFATHRFAGGGAPRTVEEQFLDSVNVTGHPIWTEVWAPLGLRYHALHHLAPKLPYHSLGAAHRLLLASLPEDDAYRSVTFAGVREAIAHVSIPVEPAPAAAAVTT